MGIIFDSLAGIGFHRKSSLPCDSSYTFILSMNEEICFIIRFFAHFFCSHDHLLFCIKKQFEENVAVKMLIQLNAIIVLQLYYIFQSYVLLLMRLREEVIVSLGYSFQYINIQAYMYYNSQDPICTR